MRLPPLEEVLKFESPEVISVFRRDFPLGHSECAEIYRETLRWVWLGVYHALDVDAQKPLELSIFSPIVVLDEMWHSFILCTRQYHKFCDQYFGAYVHHEPLVGGAKPEEDHELLKSNIAYVDSVLGSNTSALWYGVYSVKYPPELLAELRSS